LMIGGLGFSPKTRVDIHALCLPFQSLPSVETVS